jgi:hypothetical protein
MANHKRGSLLLETALALTIVAAILTSLVMATGQRQHNVRYLTEHRRLLRLVERVMTDLQLGHPAASGDEQVAIRVEYLEQSDTTADMQWVKVLAQNESHEVSLVGLVLRAAGQNASENQP